MQNYKLTLCYDGTRYFGWQRQENRSTVQGKLEAVLSEFDGETVEVHGSGRTDAGVHAKAQVASFRLRQDADCETVLQYLRQYLPEDIGVLSVEKADERFHARLNAKRKTYRYTLWTDDTPCIFLRKYVYVFRNALDINAMRQAAELLCGTHDYAAFCANSHMKKSTVRTVEKIEIEEIQHGLSVTLTANGFLHHMVRILVGTILEVGRGIRTPQSVEQLFYDKRAAAGFTVPAKGLCLMEVEY